MSLETGIPYAEALTKGIWNFFGISSYCNILYSKIKGDEFEFENVADFWKKILNTNNIKKGERKLYHGHTVKLINFTITEWFPWMPGMFWSGFGRRLRYESLKHQINVLNKSNQFLRTHLSQDSLILSPYGKTITVLSGIGGIRMNLLEAPSGRLKVLGATTSDTTRRANVSGGIPIIMTEKAYNKIHNGLEVYGSVNCTITGVFTNISDIFGPIFNYMGINIPRFCIYVGSELQIRDLNQGDEVITSIWSIFEDKKKDYNLAYCSFNVSDDEASKKASNFLMDYILKKYKGKILTECDEKISRLPALYKISEIKNGNFNMNKLFELIWKIREKYP